MTRDDHPNRKLSPDEVQKLSELVESSEHRQEPEDMSDACVEASLDDVDGLWLFIEADETAHLDERYIRASPEIVVPGDKWQ